MMPLFGLGLQNGLVLDIGYNSASVIPVYQGVPMLRSWQALPLAGKAVHQRLQSEIDKTGTAKQGEMDFVKFDTLGKLIVNFCTSTAEVFLVKVQKENLIHTRTRIFGTN